ncbi:MAG: PKD domain-containing protein [Bacteroidales bacterium]|nr:PKD domain-containing protein [Bacteroidales bacterium]MCF8389950.1 PKD domain-containing protein [Bacteroidales bacterium]
MNNIILGLSFTMVILLSCVKEDTNDTPMSDYKVSADFSTDIQLLNSGTAIHFYDHSTGGVNQWEWYFEGGTPERSTDKNPTITYNDKGQFSVSLICSNYFARDTITMDSFITVLDLNEGLVAYFPFNGNANDESKTAINGNIVDAVFTQDRFGNENSALSFDGDGDWVTCGTDNRGITNLITISLWVKSSDSNGIILSKYNIIHANPGYILFINKDGYPGLNGRDSKYGDYIRPTLSDAKINDSEWHHILATINNDKWELMVDGLLVGEILSQSLSPYLTNDIELTIGHIINDTNVPSREIAGLVDDVAIYNRILSSKEIEFIRLYGL